MPHRLLDKPIISTTLGVGMPVQSLAVSAYTDWRELIKDCNLVFAFLTGGIVAISTTVRFYREHRGRAAADTGKQSR